MDRDCGLIAVPLSHLEFECCLTIESEERETWTADVLADIPARFAEPDVDETI